MDSPLRDNLIASIESQEIDAHQNDQLPTNSSQNSKLIDLVQPASMEVNEPSLDLVDLHQLLSSKQDFFKEIKVSNNYIACSTESNCVKIYSLNFNLEHCRKFSQSIQSIRWLNDQLLVSVVDHPLMLLNHHLALVKSYYLTNANDDSIIAAHSLCCIGSRIMAGLRKGRISVIDGDVNFDFRVPKCDIVSHISVQDSIMFVGSYSNSISLLDQRTSRVIECIPTNRGVVDICHANQLLYVACRNSDAIECHDIRYLSSTPLFSLSRPGQTPQRLSLCLDPTKTHILAGSTNGNLYCWKDTELIFKREVADDVLACVDVHPYGFLFASCGSREFRQHLIKSWYFKYPNKLY